MKISKLIATYFIKDFKETVSYKMYWIMFLFNEIFDITLFIFLSFLIKDQSFVAASGLNISYALFVLIGLGASKFIMSPISHLPTKIREYQLTGVLEYMLQLPSKLQGFILGLSAWPLVLNALLFLLYIGVAIVFFGLRFGLLETLLIILILFAAYLLFLSIGIVAFGFVVLFHKGNPLGFIIGKGVALFGGVYFPTALLPVGVRWIAYINPLKYSVDAIREVCVSGATVPLLINGLILLGIGIVIFPLCLHICNRLIQRAKKLGRLSLY